MFCNYFILETSVIFSNVPQKMGFGNVAIFFSKPELPRDKKLYEAILKV